jgi:predicted DNA-binding protein (UPF0251 family)
MKKLHARSVGRPKKRRFIEADPKISQFSPRGKPGRPDEAILEIDEYEAMRLAHYKGLSQADAAESMNISQQTFSRTLKRAHRAIADALVNGKTIYIQDTRIAAQVHHSHQESAAKPAFHKLIADTKQYLSDTSNE